MPITADILRKYPNFIFVETGIWSGDGVRAALDAGFTHVISIEILPALCEAARQRFHGNPSVQIIEGDSSVELPRIVDMLTIPATFFLDAHESVDKITEGNPAPLSLELKGLAESPLHHTILIDDVRLLDTWGMSVGAIAALFPNHRTGFEDGFQANDILVLT